METERPPRWCSGKNLLASARDPRDAGLDHHVFIVICLWARTFKTMVNNNNKSGHPCLVPVSDVSRYFLNFRFDFLCDPLII